MVLISVNGDKNLEETLCDNVYILSYHWENEVYFEKNTLQKMNLLKKKIETALCSPSPKFGVNNSVDQAKVCLHYWCAIHLNFFSESVPSNS
jgi:hypothetical protein